MSNVIKGVKKVFKKVAKVVKKIAPIAIVAAAAYFTAGVALSAMPATSAFAASMPGFAGAGGAGTGILSKVAAKIGLGSLGGGSAASSVATAMGPGFMPTAASSVATQGIGGGVIKALAGSSLTDKLMLASVGTQALSALIGPSSRKLAEQEAIEAKKWRGSFYGMDESGVATDVSGVRDIVPAEQPEQRQQPAQTMTAGKPQAPQAPRKPSMAEQFTAPQLSAGVRRSAAQTDDFDLFKGLSLNG